MFFGDAVYQHSWIWLLQRQSKRGLVCLFGFGWRSWWNEAKESFSVVFFQPSCALQEPFKFNTLIYKIILFWSWRRRQLSVVIDHQTGWRLLFCSPPHKYPAIISVSLSSLLACGSGGMGDRLLSIPPPKPSISYMLLLEACSRRAI